MAWAYLLKSTPMMANPTEYRESMWSILHDGELTPEMRKRNAEKPAELGKAPPKAALDELEELRQRAVALREAKNT